MEKKNFVPVVFLGILFLLLSSCNTSAGPSEQLPPTQSYLTPASMDAIVGKSVSVIPVGNNWQVYDDPQLGIQIQYPPDWTAVKLVDTLGVGIYPRGSKPDLPTPAITFRFLNQPYTTGKTLYGTDSKVTPFYIEGIAGQQYQDTKFSIPSQSSYIELPYRDGILFIKATLGPAVDLTPQLLEMLKTLNLSSSANFPVATETLIESPTIQGSQISFIYPVDGQVLDFQGSYLFKVNPIIGADGYLWGFFQNGVKIWENIRDEGILSGTEYGILQGSLAHKKFQTWASPSLGARKINSQWTDATIINIELRP